MFLANGLGGTNVDDIAAAAGVSKQTIYNHFGDKRSLFVAVIADVQEGAQVALGNRLGSLQPDTGVLAEDLRRIARILVEAVLLEDVVALRRILIRERDLNPELVGEWGRTRSAFDTAFAAEVEEQVRRGVLDVDDIPRATRQFLQLTTQEAVFQAEYVGRTLPAAEIDRIIDEGVGLWLRAYRRRR